MHDDLMAIMYPNGVITGAARKATKEETLLAFFSATNVGIFLATTRNQPRVAAALRIIQRQTMEDWDEIWSDVIKDSPTLSDGGVKSAPPETAADLAKEFAERFANLPKSHGVVAPTA